MKYDKIATSPKVVKKEKIDKLKTSDQIPTLERRWQEVSFITITTSVCLNFFLYNKQEYLIKLKENRKDC